MTEPHLLDLLAQRDSHRAFIVDASTTLRRIDVANFAEQLDAALTRNGVGRGTAIAVAMPNGLWLAATVLAVAGFRAVTPLNPALSVHEHVAALTHLGPAALVSGTAGSAAEAAAIANDVPLFRLTIDDGAPAVELVAAGTASAAHHYDDDIALVLTTSGTTAAPKTVGLGMRNLMTSATNVASVLGLSPDDRCLNVMPLFHIHGIVGALLSSLVAGASVHCSDGFNAFAMPAQVAHPDITWVTAVPSMYQALLTRHRAGSPPPGIRLARSSSAPLPPAVWEALEDAWQCPVLNSYGMTEAAHQIASCALPPVARKVGSVGHPVGTEATLDATTNEILIRGGGVIDAYLNPASANADAFVDGWFRTGDVGTIAPDGTLTLTGRLKELINVGGEKVSPFEVEDVLLKYPGIDGAACFAVSSVRYGEQVAAVVTGSVTDADVDQLRRFARERLAKTKVPVTVVVADSIPLGPTGKVQRLRLSQQLGFDEVDT